MKQDNDQQSLSAKFGRLLSTNSLANFVYLLYAILILVIDFMYSKSATLAFHSGPLASGGVGDGTDDYYYVQSSGDAYTAAISRTNTLFVVAAAIHLFNAVQYFAVWPLHENPATNRPFGVFAWVQAPEYLNLVEAAMYMFTAASYAKEQTTGPGRYLDPTTLYTHRVEAAAAVVELVAALLWCLVWWKTHQRGAGRGLTLDDPEFIALIFLVSPSLLYVSYNALVLQNPASFYNSAYVNSLYTNGDILYFVGAFFYAVCSFRDAGFFESFGVCRSIAIALGAWKEKDEPVLTSTPTVIAAGGV